MKSFAIITVVSLLLVSNIRSQDNLVPDPGFEKFKRMDTCLSECDLLKDMLEYWIVPANDTGFFIHHTCYNDYEFRCSAPKSNIFNYQMPRTGNAYAELLVVSKKHVPAHFVQTPLIAPLIKGQHYYVEFYVNDPYTNCEKTLGKPQFLNSISVSFTKEPLSSEQSLEEIQPYVNNEKGNFLSDTANWMKVSGTFVAKGGEKYLLLANLFNWNEVKMKMCSGLTKNGLVMSNKVVWEFLFIDDVTLYAIDADGRKSDVHKKDVAKFNSNW